MNDLQAIEAAYQSAHQSSLIVQHDTPGVIELRGKDRIDLIHRLSTNDLEGMPAERVRSTVFTDPVGRTIDVVIVLSFIDKLLLVTSNGRAPTLQDWLQRHIFFQDDVSVHVSEGDWALYGAYGPRASNLSPLASPPGTLSISEHGILWKVNQPMAGILRLVSPGSSMGDWVVDTRAADAFEILRVESGLPKMNVEIQKDTIPLEVGLWDAISFTKGCYTGQEIIARMESRGKLAKQLLGVRLDAHAEPESSLMQADQIVGRLTSVVQSPKMGWIGLAIVRPSALSSHGGRVHINDNGETALLVELPFVDLEVSAPA